MAVNACRGQSRSTHEVRSGWNLPNSVRRFGARLYGQQLWCWGRDIHYPQGNLLLEFGAVRCRPPRTAERGSSCYRIDRGQQHVCLWGFGMFFGHERLGGLYLNRFEFLPHWTTFPMLPHGVFWADQLPAFGRPRSRDEWGRAHRLWRGLCRFIIDYETWTVRQ